MLHTRAALLRPVTTWMSFAALAVIGLIATQKLPLEEFPDIAFPGVFITVPYPGSTPEEVERLVTKPIEEAIATLPGIQEIRSTSNADRADVQVFMDWGGDIEARAFEVRTKLDSIRPQMPAGADRMIIGSGSTSDQPVVVVRLSADSDLSTQYQALERYLKKPLERLAGVARVDLAGVEPQEVRILVNADRAAAHGVSLPRLRDILQKSNFSVSAGEVTEQGQRFSVRPVGEFTSLEDIRNLVIDGNVRLDDVADVALYSPKLSMGRRVDQRPAVGLDVFKTTQGNVIEVVDLVLAELERAKSLPQLQGVRFLVVGNQAQSIQSSLSDLREAGLIGAGLALIVLFLFLRDVPTTLMVSLAVPASLLVTLGAMYFTGLTLNVLTMMGMMLSVGMLVDNAVVVTESVFRHRAMNPDQPMAATLAGVKEVGIATLAGTFATVVVFLPLLFGETNQISIFLKHVAIPIVVSMIASLLIAQTLIPMIAARIRAPREVTGTSWMGRLQERYARSLAWVLSHPWKTAGLVMLTVLSPIPLFALELVKVDPFPQTASRQLFLPYHLTGNQPIERVEAAVHKVEAYLVANKERFDIDSVYSRWTYDEAGTLIYLRPKEVARRKSADIMEDIVAGMPDIIIGKPDFKFENTEQQGFSIQLTGDSTERLSALSLDVARRLGQVKGLEAVRSEAQGGDEEVRVVVDRDRAAAVGLTTQSIAVGIAAAMRGDRLREFRAADRELTMRLAFRADDQQSVDDLARLALPTPTGTVPLSSVASFTLERGEQTIQRINRLTAVVITANLAKGVTMEEMRKQVTPIMEAYPLPPGYSWKLGRGFEDNDKTLSGMMTNILLSVLMIYIVMAALFESALHPLSIVTSIVFAIVGVFWFFAATQTPITLMAMIGIMILIGVVVNIGIVLVAHILQLRAEGMDRTSAILQAGRDRLRPIMMTTLSTLLGLLPLAVGDTQVGGGAGGPAYYPMARAIMGGLAFGAVVSLFFVPAFYVWFDDFNAWRARVFRRPTAPAAITASPGP
jgi:hydrophobic/amphiphilic exporter-1 (mainly G- bacteria), HAE1 family